MILLKYLKNLAGYRSENNFIVQNNYVERFNCWWQCKKFCNHSSNQFERPNIIILLIQPKLFLDSG